MKNVLVILLVPLLFCACATAGKEIDLTTVHDKISVNQSTKEDVRALFGEPLSKSFDAENESEIWHYAYVKKNITGAGLIEHTFRIGSEWKTKTSVVDFYFRKGVVVDIKSESSQTKKFHLQ
ncbi:MAG: hypothetical protein GXP58_07475 [Deltaproteobacteria bacterium]|nr:hypothetical protein [Deltaproteobacteria bacterium]